MLIVIRCFTCGFQEVSDKIYFFLLILVKSVQFYKYRRLRFSVLQQTKINLNTLWFYYDFYESVKYFIIH